MAKFSVSISYPPLNSDKGIAFLSQNRQFQWTHTDNVIYPVIPASAATLLKSKGFKVYWDDAIAQRLSYQQWFKRLVSRRPNLIVIETKTPVIQQHWQIIKDIKKKLPQSHTVLMGDHVTALPHESLKNCPVNYILKGGDYDLLLLSLATQLSTNQNPPKIIASTPDHHLDQIPIIDHQLTCWQDYANRNSNFKYHPGAYIMSGRDCWWGKCTFCSWTTLFPHDSYRRFSVKHAIAEVENLINLGVKEIFDDSGTLPVGDWLTDFCHQIIDKGLNKKCHFGCNMRFDALTQENYQLMAKAGFRLILFGFESANPKTLKKINKNIDPAKIRNELGWAKKVGLEPHITVMIGYPWENLADAQKTLHFARNLFKQNLVSSLQATRIIPYPGTPLFSYCQKNNLLLTQNWADYDMSRPVIKSPISPQKQQQLIKNLFKGVLTPKFLLNQIISIHNFSDLKHLAGYSIKFLQKLKDF
ncbi:B12-binding domain-containing radical SAM protein [Patescibacteria group bacterium]|nr:B12-binding domain-containing radical SAM protein [Patescibacteria group bacterium]